MPRSALCSFGAFVFCCGFTFCCGRGLPINHRGSASASTFSSERTSAERLSDLRKTRREEDKRSLPGSLGRAKIRPSLLYAREPRVCKRQPSQIPHAKDDSSEFQDCSPLVDEDVHSVCLRGSDMRSLLAVPGPNKATLGVNAHDPHLGISTGGGNSGGTVRQRDRSSGGVGLSAKDLPRVSPYVSCGRSGPPRGEPGAHANRSARVGIDPVCRGFIPCARDAMRSGPRTWSGDFAGRRDRTHRWRSKQHLRPISNWNGRQGWAAPIRHGTQKCGPSSWARNHVSTRHLWGRRLPRSRIRPIRQTIPRPMKTRCAWVPLKKGKTRRFW